MEELNNNVTEIIEVETIEPVEVLETIESNDGITKEQLGVGAVIVTGLVAGVYFGKKLWDKRKAKKETVLSHTVVTETIVEKEEPVIEETK